MQLTSLLTYGSRPALHGAKQLMQTYQIIDMHMHLYLKTGWLTPCRVEGTVRMPLPGPKGLEELCEEASAVHWASLGQHKEQGAASPGITVDQWLQGLASAADPSPAAPAVSAFSAAQAVSSQGAPHNAQKRITER